MQKIKTKRLKPPLKHILKRRKLHSSPRDLSCISLSFSKWFHRSFHLDLLCWLTLLGGCWLRTSSFDSLGIVLFVVGFHQGRHLCWKKVVILRPIFNQVLLHSQESIGQTHADLILWGLNLLLIANLLDHTVKLWKSWQLQRICSRHAVSLLRNAWSCKTCFMRWVACCGTCNLLPWWGKNWECLSKEIKVSKNNQTVSSTSLINKPTCSCLMNAICCWPCIKAHQIEHCNVGITTAARSVEQRFHNTIHKADATQVLTGWLSKGVCFDFISLNTVMECWKQKKRTVPGPAWALELVSAGLQCQIWRISLPSSFQSWQQQQSIQCNKLSCSKPTVARRYHSNLNHKLQTKGLQICLLYIDCFV